MIRNKPHIFAKNILRAYDIRGIFGQDLNLEDAYYIARSLVTFLRSENFNNSVCIGYDGRASSLALFDALKNGFIDADVDVYNIGLVPTPLLYFASHTIPEAILAIMITGSHNPAQYNGFKIVFNKAPLYGEKLQNLAEIAAKGELSIGSSTGAYHQLDMSCSYINRLLAIPIHKPLKIAWDPGGGAACGILEQLVQKLPGEHIIINGKVDSTFSSHHPDPTQEKNMLQLVETVIRNQCDLGIAFDGDADRLGAVDSSGKILYGDHILSILSKDLLDRHPAARIIGDVKMSRVVFEQIRKWGGHPIMWKTGHALIKIKMKEIGAILAGEMSGHIFFAENYYGFDDAILGALQLISIVSSHGININNILQDYRGWISTSEIKLEVDEEIKFGIIKQVQGLLIEQGIAFNDLDGIRVESEDGWWLLRASNTENCLIARAEGKNHQILIRFTDQIRNLFDAALLKGV